VEKPVASVARFYASRAQRFALELPLHYQKSGMPHWHEGKTLNISSTGILFCTDEALPQNATLDIRVDFPSKVTLACQGSIVRSEESAFAVRIHRYRLHHA
jgi:hypothetical protein